MKDLFALLMISVIISFVACGQKLKASKVPAIVKESFAKQFPGATAKWEKEDGKFEAGFTFQNNSMSALFEANGTMTESEIEIEISELPANILAYLKTNHNGTTIKEVAKITKANGEMIYEAEIKGKDLLFDMNGNFIEEVEN
ncbi:MAG: PepSY-like domain-containing protein [Chitinophagaceae bacterium]|nr:PepSY-like domain-containing protein [Chitinophagaceae bacterium]MBK8310959.1 PepSY-like domain-containing protein [Chitinophagaceae bacterium]MBP6477077.1 PepSY-like domain-containing protein [Chitinophagaceae bacterium]MBP7108550.1 PepSY-like domain-containing protein [Chitinophagaceae bacterium]MBP7314952.1 PepSY-like domain-containing protein [Chitinophagaceae bacterium]